jgi:2-hydroxychromene-2-carboxylate isomerase
MRPSPNWSREDDTPGRHRGVKLLEVFADVACPFAHVGLHRFVLEREARGLDTPVLSVRAWPLELGNGQPMTGASLVAKIAALREQVAPGRFEGFDPARFPSTTLPALAGEVAARRRSPVVGEAFSLAVRDALFERGADVGDPAVVNDLLSRFDVAPISPDDEADVLASFEEGRVRGVKGSPHFFVGESGFFCPSLDIEHDDDGYEIRFDLAGFTSFIDAAFRDR